MLNSRSEKDIGSENWELHPNKQNRKECKQQQPKRKDAIQQARRDLKE